jgi:CDP-diacylglycerol--serine O-phosphatidyltransferase
MFWSGYLRIFRVAERNESTPTINRHAPRSLLLRFLVVNAFTAANLTLGILSILSTMTGHLTLGALLLLASVVLDMMDGNLARRWRVATDFGAQMDSLADMVAFTVSSALLAWYWLSPQLPPSWMTGACALYVLMGSIRLARFNSTASAPGYFQGVPTTVVAGIVATTYLLLPGLDANIALALFVLLAALMVTTLPYGKFVQLKRLPRALWVVIAAGLVVNTQLTVFAVEVAYLLSGPFMWWRLRRGAR